MAAWKIFWQAEWGADIFYMHGSKHSRGMILFRPSLCKKVLNVTVGKNSRFIIVNTTFNKDELCCNIYAPNHQNQQISFYQKITDSIRSHQTNKILIGGL